jgi:hypothetical protein
MSYFMMLTNYLESIIAKEKEILVQLRVIGRTLTHEKRASVSRARPSDLATYGVKYSNSPNK